MSEAADGRREAAGLQARAGTRRDFVRAAGLVGLGALVAEALPVAERLAPALGPEDAVAAVAEPDGTLQAFADTVLPGRIARLTDLGDPIHPRAIAGVDGEAGAVEADALRVFHDPLIGFDALEPAFLADLSARAVARGGPFLSLGYEERVATVMGGLDFGNPARVLWEAAAAVPFVAFCAASAQPAATRRTASGYDVMGFPGPAPRGYPRSFSYRRRLNRGVTEAGSLP